MFRWTWERFRHGVPPDPDPGQIPRREPEVAAPRLPVGVDDVRVTWIGHATFLIQVAGANILTDPMFSDRASPFRRLGPRRFVSPGLVLGALPPVDVVLLSHDHYDHLDVPTIEGLRDRYGEDLTWLTPLGYRSWFGHRGVTRVVELDWWEDASLETSAGAFLRVTALPARHWTRRRMWDTRRRLWCSWGVASSSRRVYFGGDSGYGPAYAEIGARLGPFDVALLPIGAYEPRWFMASSHITPEEATRAAADLGAAEVVGGHWGTFRLTDEDPLEPPARMRAAWAARGLPPSRLHIPAVGETVHFSP